ncbi:histidinol-phosphate transaminase [Geoglobus acetivorans]|uniref:Histidinol-phosphate aminotransferase n=1 Tax=Geoglobus acetivorans TaxID=565033 RepID=A0A0A7GF71_GEOAI|nr:Histidinol-phosphate aminotransferase [Geoglobus acetivorans]
MRSDIDRIPEYVPGKSIEEIKKKYGLKRIIKLASNENPYGFSPLVAEILKNPYRLNVYPPSDPEELRERISEYIGYEPEMIALSAGMDGVLESVFKMLIDPGDGVCYAPPTFPYYSILARIYRADEIRLKRDANYRMAEYVKGAKLTIICTPNNPTGNSEDFDFVREVIESVRGYVFIDEAYAEFAERDMLKLAEYENVIIGRTFSKAFGLANLRVGYGIMHPSLRKAFMKVNPPFSLSSIAISAALAALEDTEWMKETVRKIIYGRGWLYSELKKIARPVKSDANFIFFETDISSRDLAERLERRGVIVRSLRNFDGAGENAVRVSVGTEEQNRIFVDALREVLCSQ